MRNVLFCICLFMVFSGTVLEAQYFKPFTGLRVIKTGHFDIIYPKESEKTAMALAGFADTLYDKVTELLDIHYSRRIPVTITPHTEYFNGFAYAIPYPHIVLLDSATTTWFNYPNFLEGLFIHELTHVISLSSRSPFFNVIHAIFGGWVMPTGLNTPLFMAEGVSVSFESLDGGGRVNDPVLKETLSQAVHENRFLTPFQASGVYDLPPFGNVYYYYGGLFSAWLQKKYGMEKYAEFWKAMGREFHFSFVFLNTGSYYSFRRIYGRPFKEAWNEFMESMRVTDIEENSDGVVYNGPFYNKKVLVSGMAGGGGKVFFVDKIDRKVLSYDPQTDSVETLMPADPYIYHIAASADGERLLLSHYRYEGELARAVVTEYNVRRNSGPFRKTGRHWESLYEGGYFRDGVLGIGSDRHITNIVYRPSPGKAPDDAEEVLLRGSEELLYSNPVALNDDQIIFIAAKKGKRELCLYNYGSREVFTLTDDGERWRSMRHLQVSEGRILFSYNHDGGMYKLALIELPKETNAEILFSDRNFSGGVFLPVMAGGNIYYRGAFAIWDALMRFPEQALSLSGERVVLSVKPWEEEYLTAAFPPEGEQGGRTGQSGSAPPVFPSKPYFGITYLNPFSFWLPYPIITINNEALFPSPGITSNNEALNDENPQFGFSLDGGGIVSYIRDPEGNNTALVYAGFDARSLMAIFDVQWINTFFGLPITFTVSDTLDKSRSVWSGTVRHTIAGISLSYGHGIGGESVRFSIMPVFQTGFSAVDPENNTNPYTWPYVPPLFSTSLGAGISTLTKNNWEVFGNGVSLAAYGRYAYRETNSWEPRFEGTLQIALEPAVPLQFQFFGAWDKNRMTLSGESTLYASTAFDHIAPSEYSNNQYSLDWLAGGEAEVKLFSAEIQRSLSHIYFNRIFGTLAYRAGFYDDHGNPAATQAGNPLWDNFRLTQSLVFRLGLTLSSAIVPTVPGKLTFNVWTIWRMSNAWFGYPYDFTAGFGFSM